MSKAIKWSEPNDYTGGDVSPVPLRIGGIIYVKYNVDAKGQSYSQLWLAKRPRDPGRALTQPEESCAQPALSADQSQVAMVCAGDQRTTRLVVAPFDGSGLGPRRTLVEGKLAAGPSWAPDGASLVFYAPGATSNATGNFQLWWLPVPAAAAAAAPAAGSPTPAPAPTPKQVTDNLAFDALSPAAWLK
jgi:Tol biopolymer transport system component